MAEVLLAAPAAASTLHSTTAGIDGKYYGKLEHSVRSLYAKRRVEDKIAEFFNSRPKDDLAQPSDRGPSSEEVQPGEYVRLKNIKLKTGLPGQTVCIIGAGVAGLFTAMTIDYLNKQVPGLNLKYEILEAADEDRFGGRLYTHRFSDGLHDYYDIGAMRFPDIPIMKRTFKLFEYLDIEQASEPTSPPTKGSLPSPPKLIPYYLRGENCPYYFNNLYYPKPPKGVTDPFSVQSKKDDDKIPLEFLKQGSDGPGAALLAAIKPFKEALRYDIDKDLKRGPGWKLLMKADDFSVRQYLSRLKFDINTLPPGGIKDLDKKYHEDPPLPPGPEYNYRTIEWIETFGSGTLNFDEAFSEAVLGALDFDYNDGDKTLPPVNWWCIEGGAQLLAYEMRKKICYPNAIKCKSRVTMIRFNPNGAGDDDDTMTVRVGPQKDDGAGADHREYAAVFNSTTLAAMQRMDLTGAVLNYETKVAIRALRYGVSCKIGIKFKDAWWLKAPFDIKEGGVGYTDLPLRVCVYPSYNINDVQEDDPTPTEAVLLCSYTWGQDAQRLSALISKKDQKRDEELKEIIFNNLALLHCPQKDGKTDPEAYKTNYKLIKDLYMTHHAYDWAADPFMSGAFAHFGPGQFSRMYPDIITPSAGGRLFIIGEAASKHHAWVVGALESAVRGVYQLLNLYEDPEAVQACEFLEEVDPETKKPYEDRWPFAPVPFEELGNVKNQINMSIARERAKRKDLINGLK